MSDKNPNQTIIWSLFLTVILWGANNTAAKYLVHFWPTGLLGCTRMLVAGVFLLSILYGTSWLGKPVRVDKSLDRELWWKCVLNLAIYIVCFNLALRHTTASHVALYLGMSPIWTLVWDHPPSRTWLSVQRYTAAAMAFGGVLVLFWPALSKGKSAWLGEAFGFSASLLWASYGIVCRGLSNRLSGAEISAHSMWRAGVLQLPVAIYELSQGGIVWRADLFLVQGYCCIAGGGIAYVLWNNALKHWPTSKVFLFNNLIPITTVICSWIFLHEPVTKTFWMAMSLVVCGVLLGQTRWDKFLRPRTIPQQ